MKIFISWSGELSHRVALTLKDWLNQQVHNSIDAFVSSVDIAQGTVWSSKILNELEDSQFGIVCVTHENITAPWIYFEAGALYANKQAANATPFLVDMQLNDLDKKPFSIFQATKFKKEDVKKLVKTINKNLDDRAKHSEDLVDEYFETIWWKKLETKLNEVLKTYAEECKQKQDSENREYYCPVSEDFISKLEHIYKTHIIPPMDVSDLWYVVINTINFKPCKAKILELLNEMYERRGVREELYDISVWSLLGEAELLLKFRARKEMATEIGRRLSHELSGGGDNSHNLLEPTNISPEGLTIINVCKELVRTEEHKLKSFQEGRFIQSKPIPKTLRSIKVFIRLRYQHGHDTFLQTSILNRLWKNIDSIEAITFTDEPEQQPGHIIVEAHFPCGRFGDLGKISSDLELELFPNLVKETYLAYEVDVVGADDAEIAPQTEAIVFK